IVRRGPGRRRADAGISPVLKIDVAPVPPFGRTSRSVAPRTTRAAATTVATARRTRAAGTNDSVEKRSGARTSTDSDARRAKRTIDLTMAGARSHVPAAVSSRTRGLRLGD